MNPSNIVTVFREEAFHALRRSPGFYRPFLMLSLMLDARLSGISSYGYHFTNVLIHLLAACLVFRLLIKLGYARTLSTFFSLAFTVHPTLTTAVAWIPGRNDSLLAVFLFSAFLFFMNFMEKGKWRDYVLHLLLFACALFTKESAILVLVLCVVYSLCIARGRPLSSRTPILLAGWVPLAILWFILRRAAIADPAKETIVDMGRSFLAYMPAIVQLIGKALLPVNLSVLPTMEDTAYSYGIVATALVLAAVAFSKKARMNFVIFGASWFLLFLLAPFARIQARTVPDFQEHRLYIALFGFSVLLLETDVMRRFNARPRALALVGGAVIAVFSTITFIHSGNFRDELAFWKNAVMTSPRFFLVHRNLGAVYQMHGMLDEAMHEYRKALELEGLAEVVHNNLGCIYLTRNMVKEAEEEFRKECAVNPRSDSSLVNLGLLAYRHGRPREAEEYWKRALRVNDNNIEASRNLAIYYYEKRDFEEAARYVSWLRERRVPVPRNVLEALGLEKE
jgi:Tfp pilus assembly protein PilF